MSSYIKSEFYRLIRNRATYLFIGICSVILMSSNVVLAAVKYAESDFPYATTGFSYGNIISSMNIVFLLCIMVGSMIFGNEHNNHTMKNCVSYGIPRGTIYFSKFMVEIVYSLIAFTIITGFHVISANLLLENSGPGTFTLLLHTLFACLPLLLSALATTNCFVFIIEGTGSGIAAIVGVLVAIPTVSNLLGMKFDFFAQLSKVLPWNLINAIDFEKYTLILPWEGNAGYRNYWLVGIIWMIGISLLGYVVFRKKEIK
ncbi:MAG: ABC transporter permease [Mobilitalea sp.]